MKHTALPWTEPRIYKDANGVPYRIAIYAADHDSDICSTRLQGRDYIAEGNFDLISRACNSHDELVKLCKELADFLYGVSESEALVSAKTYPLFKAKYSKAYSILAELTK